jgi:hypothetical protein
MKKKWGILVVIVLLGVLAAAVWTFSRPEKTIVVEGNVSAQEVREIKQAVKSAMRKQVFPGFSWSNLKAFPARANRYLRRDVRSITAYGPDDAAAVVAESVRTNSSPRELYCVAKGTNGWKAYRRVDL